MKFEIDLLKLLQDKLTINNYLFLQLVYHQNYDYFINYKKFDNFINKDDILFLMSVDLIEFNDPDKGYYLSNFKVTNNFINRYIDIKPDIKINKRIETSNVEEWMDEWYSLFPRGIKNGAYPIKGDRKGCLKKLKSFVKDYPEFSKDVIMKATKEYINKSKLNNYVFMQQAHYFISKNNISTLASYCELVENNDITTSSTDKFNKSLN